MAISFVIRHDAGGDVPITISNMAPAEITAMFARTGISADIVSKAVYDALVIAQTPTPVTPAEILAAERSQAIGELLTGTQPLTKLERAILLVILDEVNVIRALLPGPPAPRTITQFKTAVQAKINAGTAD